VAPTQSVPSVDAVKAALNEVHDPEINRPITELGMVKDVTVATDGTAKVAVWLTVAGCPMRDTITSRVTTAVSAVPGIRDVQVELDVMSDAQRTALRQQLRGDAPTNEIPFAQPGSRTRVYAVASGKGGVGKSSVTVNVAAALARFIEHQKIIIQTDKKNIKRIFVNSIKDSRVSWLKDNSYTKIPSGKH